MCFDLIWSYTWFICCYLVCYQQHNKITKQEDRTHIYIYICICVYHIYMYITHVCDIYMTLLCLAQGWFMRNHLQSLHQMFQRLLLFCFLLYSNISAVSVYYEHMYYKSQSVFIFLLTIDSKFLLHGDHCYVI